MESFWDFSVRTYRIPGVPDACLSLQNDYGADVNMLLYCAWIGAASGEFDRGLFRHASEFSERWAENVVIPLRDARTWMKHTGCDADAVPTESCMALRDEIKTVEFAAEKMQQEALASMLVAERRDGGAADHMMQDVVANLDMYAGHIGLDIKDDVKQKLSIIIGAAFPHWNISQIGAALDT
jgi:uncharacterized protein (TIGR02444 family)